MVTIAQGLIDPILFYARGRQPQSNYYKFPADSTNGMDPRNDFIVGLFSAAIAAVEYFALRAFMAQMPNAPTSAAVGFFCYRGMSSLVGYQPTDAAMGAWLVGRVISSVSERPNTAKAAGFIVIQTLLAAGLFFHKFACIDSIKTPLIDKVRGDSKLYEFKGRDFAFERIKGWLPQ